MAERLFIAIAVHQPGGDLDPLPGALASSKRIAEWAKAARYRVVEIRDELDDAGAPVPVTTDRIRYAVDEEIDQIWNVEKKPIDRIIFHFAGHGAVKTDFTNYWLLSRWNENDEEAVWVQGLMRALGFSGIRQAALFGDACGTLDPKVSFDIHGSKILLKKTLAHEEPENDMFLAADFGLAAYAFDGDNPADAYCLFTEKLLDALEGDAPNAQNGAGRVTSATLALYLKKAIRDAAVELDLGEMRIHTGGRGFATHEDFYAAFSPAPPGPQPTGVFKAEGGLPPSGRRATRKIAMRPRATPTDQKAAASRNERAKRLAATMAALEAAQAGVAPHSGIVVHGAKVAGVERLWGVGSATLRSERALDVDPGDSFIDLAITTTEGATAYLCSIAGFGAELLLSSGEGPAFINYGAPGHDAGIGGAIARDVIAGLNAGLLSADDAISIAADIRWEKHANLTLGCVAAYLYESIGDIDSVRQMASFYPRRNQPIPFDIALLSRGLMRMTATGVLSVDLPAVKARTPQNEAELDAAFTTESSPAVNRAPVAGRMPWLRGGWRAAETANADDSATEWFERIAALARDVSPAPISIFEGAAAEKLLALSEQHAMAGGAA